jgi:putative copper export protein
VVQVPAVAVFTFDEALNPTLTRVFVTTAAGRKVAAGPGHLAPGQGQRRWELPLPRLADGTYSVYWTSESAIDGHVMSSFYTFQVATRGHPNEAGSTIGATSGGATGTAGGLLGGLSGGVLSTALVHWISLMAQALWLGGLLLTVAVLRPARRRGDAAERHLAARAAPRTGRLVCGALVVTALALAGEEVSLALQGTDGDWGLALAPATLGGILASQNGYLVVARAAIVLAALVLSMAGRAPRDATESATRPAAQRVPPRGQALGIVAPLPARPAWPPADVLQISLAALYMVLVAFSGHAADVAPAVLSCGIDTLHLVGTAAWAGGIAALAWAVLPVRHALPPDRRAPAVLALLDRFSPIAYGAVGILVLSGLFNAVVHVASPAAVTGTLYGQILLAKGALVGLLMLLSAEHTYVLRPSIARRHRAALAGMDGAAARAGVHEGLATLAGRLRLEGYVGASVLLASALLSQTLPAPKAAMGRVMPASISGTVMVGALHGTLTVEPPAVGMATFTLHLSYGRAELTAATAAVIIHLTPAGHPGLQANLDPDGRGAQFVVRGSLASRGVWQATVLVRPATATSYQTLRFSFTVGPGAAFVAPRAHTPRAGITAAPGRMGTNNTFSATAEPPAAVVWPAAILGTKD